MRVLLLFLCALSATQYRNIEYEDVMPILPAEYDMLSMIHGILYWKAQVAQFLVISPKHWDRIPAKCNKEYELDPKGDIDCFEWVPDPASQFIRRLFGRPSESMSLDDVAPTRKAKDAILHFSEAMTIKLLVEMFFLQQEFINKKSPSKEDFVSRLFDYFSENEHFKASIIDSESKLAKINKKIADLHQINDCLFNQVPFPNGLLVEDYGIDKDLPRNFTEVIKAIQRDLLPVALVELSNDLGTLEKIMGESHIDFDGMNGPANKRLQAHLKRLDRSLVKLAAIKDDRTGGKSLRYPEIASLVKQNITWDKEFVESLKNCLPDPELSREVQAAIGLLNKKVDATAQLAKLEVLGVAPEILEDLKRINDYTLEVQKVMDLVSNRIRDIEKGELQFYCTADVVVAGLKELLGLAFDGVHLQSGEEYRLEPNTLFAALQAYLFAKDQSPSAVARYYHGIKTLIPDMEMKERPDCSTGDLTNKATATEVECAFFNTVNKYVPNDLFKADWGLSDFPKCNETTLLNIARALLYDAEVGRTDKSRVTSLGYPLHPVFEGILEETDVDRIEEDAKLLEVDQIGFIYKRITRIGEDGKPKEQKKTENYRECNGFIKWSDTLKRIFGADFDENKVFSVPGGKEKYRVYCEPWVGEEEALTFRSVLAAINNWFGLGLPDYFNIDKDLQSCYEQIARKLPFLNASGNGFTTKHMRIVLPLSAGHSRATFSTEGRSAISLAFRDIYMGCTPSYYEYHALHCRLNKGFVKFRNEFQLNLGYEKNKFYYHIMRVNSQDIYELKPSSFSGLLSFPFDGPPCGLNDGFFKDLSRMTEELGSVERVLNLNPQVRKRLLQLLEGDDFKKMCSSLEKTMIQDGFYIGGGGW